MDMKKEDVICFFGASVTAQETGYAKVLQTELQEKVYIFGYGGRHLNNAGICYIDNVLACHPMICFIDWFSTDYNECSEKTIEYLDTIVYKFTRANCKLIFLFFQYRNSNYPTKEMFYGFCKSYLLSKGLAFVDVCAETNDVSLELLLRDSIHTTEEGSHIYASIIKNKFLKMKENIEIPSHVTPTNYVNIQHINVEREFYHRLILCGKCEILGIDLLVGKHSGIVYILEANRTTAVNIWDKWCYYNRDHFRINMMVDGRVSIVISNEAFDTSTCKVPIDVKKVRKKLVIHGIYYVGENLCIENEQEGKPICWLAYEAPKWYRKKRDGVVKVVKKVFPFINRRQG